MIAWWLFGRGETKRPLRLQRDSRSCGMPRGEDYVLWRQSWTIRRRHRPHSRPFPPLPLLHPRPLPRLRLRHPPQKGVSSGQTHSGSDFLTVTGTLTPIWRWNDFATVTGRMKPALRSTWSIVKMSWLASWCASGKAQKQLLMFFSNGC
jgi:hypothetical protein